MEGVQCCSTRTLFPDIEVKSIHLHDIRHVLLDKVFEGESGWVLQGIMSRASFRREPLSGPKSFTVHMINSFAKMRGIGKKLLFTIRAVMLEEHVDVVAGAFKALIASVSQKKPSPTVPCRCLPAPHQCGVRERFRVRGQTCVDFSSPPTQMNGGEYGNTVPFPFSTKLLASDRLIRAAITRYGFTRTLVERRRVQSHQERHEERLLLLKERSAPYHYHKPMVRM